MYSKIAKKNSKILTYICTSVCLKDTLKMLKQIFELVSQNIIWLMIWFVLLKNTFSYYFEFTVKKNVAVSSSSVYEHLSIGKKKFYFSVTVWYN